MVKLARDSQLIGSALSEADPPLSEADVNVAYTAEVTRAGKVAAGAGGDRRKCNFNDFLTVLMKLAIKVYPRSKSVDDAFQRLLMDNVLPLASRRAPDDISMFLENDDVRRLAEYYGDALEQIFSFYATADKRTHAQIASLSASAALAAGGAGMSLGGRPPAGGRATKSSNSMKEALSYPAFLTFAAAFDLSNSVLISNVELGDIYLSSLKNVTPDASSRKLSYDEFFEALVRCALVGYSKVSDVSVLDKVRRDVREGESARGVVIVACSRLRSGAGVSRLLCRSRRAHASRPPPPLLPPLSLSIAQQRAHPLTSSPSLS